MDDKIPYWKTNRFLGAFVWKEGDDGCIICADSNGALSLNRPPPPLRDQSPTLKVPKAVIKKKKPKEHEFLLNVISGINKVVDTKRRFRAWLDSPDPPRVQKPAVVQQFVEKTNEPIPAYDIQQMPDTMRALGMPKAAKMFDKWFAGGLNYSPDSESSKAEINQNGLPFPQSMIDRTSVSLPQMAVET